MSDFKAKMPQIRFRLGLRPRHAHSALDPAGGAYSAPPDPLAVLRGLFLKRCKEREGKLTGGERKETGGHNEGVRRGKKWEGEKGREETPQILRGLTPMIDTVIISWYTQRLDTVFSVS